MKFEDKVSRLRKEKFDGKETQAFLEDVKKMCEGEAFEYLLGEVSFCGAKVDLSLRPMIPRPETECWLGQAIMLEKKRVESGEVIEASEKSSTFRSLDLFAGSGCVGLAVLKNISAATVDFIEIDPKSKLQIERSLDKNKIDHFRAKVMTGDCFEGATGVYNIIFAVPPYVPKGMQEEVMQELHAEEPLFFFDKEDGFYFHTEVLKRAKEFLKNDGVLYLEFDITQREKIEVLVKESGFTDYTFLQDPYGHECVIALKNVFIDKTN